VSDRAFSAFYSAISTLCVLVQGVGWLVVILLTAKLAGCIELAVFIDAPQLKEQPVQIRTEHPDIKQLKRDARRLSKDQPLTHGQALERLAQQRGYKTYASMRAALREQQS
jgi:hypothetical protein